MRGHGHGNGLRRLVAFGATAIAAACVTACGARTPGEPWAEDAPASANDAGAPRDRVPRDAAGAVLRSSTVYVIADRLYAIDVPSFELHPIGEALAVDRTRLLALALDPDGSLVAVDSDHIVHVDVVTGALDLGPELSLPATTPHSAVSGLAAGADGTLYAGYLGSVYAINPAGGQARWVADYPSPLKSSGDLAFVGGRLFATATEGSGDAMDVLVEIDAATHASRVIGSAGMRCLYGLAAVGPVLYGFACTGAVASIDTTTGQATEVARLPIVVSDAASR